MEFTLEEEKIIKKDYENGVEKLKKVSILSILLGIGALLVPPGFWNTIGVLRKKRHHLDDVTEAMYTSPSMILIVCLVIIIAIVFTYYAYVHFVKKDLQSKEKMRGEFKVVKVQHLSKNIAEKLDGLDTVLHFEKNDAKIKKHLFSKSKKPELLNAKSIIIERSKYAGIIFKEEITL